MHNIFAILDYKITSKDKTIYVRKIGSTYFVLLNLLLTDRKIKYPEKVFSRQNLVFPSKWIFLASNSKRTTENTYIS